MSEKPAPGPEEEKHNNQSPSEPRRYRDTEITTEELNRFVAELRQNKEEILDQVQKLRYKPDKTREELMLAIFLDAVLKSEVFDIDPFASKRPGDEEIQDDRLTLALIAIEFTADQWLVKNPNSQPTKDILKHNLVAPKDSYLAMLHEMWPSILPIIVDLDTDDVT